MGFWDVVGNIASAILQEGAKAQARAQEEASRKINEYERKVSNAEKSGRMNDPEFARKVHEAREKVDNAKQKVYGSSSSGIKTNTNGQTTIGGKTVAQWESQWRSLGILRTLTLDDLSPYNHSIGLYKAEIGGKIYYIGRAIEHSNGGFRKRLRDYLRESNSARTHKSGGKMNENADRIHISILVMGNSEAEVDAVKALESQLVMKHKPEWNVQFNRL